MLKKKLNYHGISIDSKRTYIFAKIIFEVIESGFLPTNMKKYASIG